MTQSNIRGGKAQLTRMQEEELKKLGSSSSSPESCEGGHKKKEQSQKQPQEGGTHFGSDSRQKNELSDDDFADLDY